MPKESCDNSPEPPRSSEAIRLPLRRKSAIDILMVEPFVSRISVLVLTPGELVDLMKVVGMEENLLKDKNTGYSTKLF
jgi:hypothetical protein